MTQKKTPEVDDYFQCEKGHLLMRYPILGAVHCKLCPQCDPKEIEAWRKAYGKDEES